MVPSNRIILFGKLNLNFMTATPWIYLKHLTLNTMDEIFEVYEPPLVKELIEEMFTGYINSPTCEIGYLGDMYELKRLIDAEADKRLNRSNNG